ncbi:Microtubule-associated serine/threonine-protein kinase 4 [Cricetulus griseus]|uniref:Microtubule-associated serine/threonine-protein kinase 4 n=1 Tax=Cricetulus griseus TaxID=10029 RepID=G3H4N0_CRIGR|nr:Microtubule-associated serine/threonine-protein kinase 4 [Cricetulus griseus]
MKGEREKREEKRREEKRREEKRREEKRREEKRREEKRREEKRREEKRREEKRRDQKSPQTENPTLEDKLDHILSPPPMPFRKCSNPDVACGLGKSLKYKRQLSGEGKQLRRGSLGGALTEHSFKKPLEPSFTVFTEWVSLSVLGVFYAIQAFTIEGKYFDAFVEVSAVFPCQSEDLLRPRFNGTHSCQLALLADAASQRHCQSAFCYCSSPLQMAY